MTQGERFLFVLIVTALITGCLDPYAPPVIHNNDHYLVVDAFFDPEKGDATVNLTKTLNLDDKSIRAPRETGATVFIDIKDGVSHALTEISDGLYTASGLYIDYGVDCRLRIRTINGNEYHSDYVRTKATPEIDSLTWQADERGLRVHVTTHDALNQTTYYRWTYEETIEYYSAWESRLYYNPVSNSVEIRDRNTQQQIYKCWKTYNSTGILNATSRGLTQDIISKFKIIDLLPDSWKHKEKYSVFVRQYAIDEQEFTYWNQLKKVTENVGTIFDPQPSQVLGNLRCVNFPQELVLGYFSVSSVTMKRIFISGKSLPYQTRTSPYDFCSAYNDIKDTLLDEFWESPTRFTLLVPLLSPVTGFLMGYKTAPLECVDCRAILGGTNFKPDFWE